MPFLEFDNRTADMWIDDKTLPAIAKLFVASGRKWQRMAVDKDGAIGWRKGARVQLVFDQ